MTQEELQNYYFFKNQGKIFGGVLRPEIALLSPKSREIFKNFIHYNYHGGKEPCDLQTLHLEKYASIFAQIGAAANQSILLQLKVADKDPGPQKSELSLTSLTRTLYSPGSSPSQLLTQFVNVFLKYFFFSARLHEGWHPDTGQLFSKYLLNESINVEQLLTVRLRILYNWHISLDKRK